MNQKLLHPNTLAQNTSPRVLKASPVKTDYNLGKINFTNYEDLPKQSSLDKKQPQSNKVIGFHRAMKYDAENQQCPESKGQRQISKVKYYYETQIRTLNSAYKRAQQELEARLRGMEKEKNQWKEIARKLKSELETRVSTLPSSTSTSNHNQTTSTFNQENSQKSINISGSITDELMRLKSLNSQLQAELNKYRDENRLLREQVAKFQSISGNGIVQKNLMEYNTKTVIKAAEPKRHESPHRNTSQSPSKHRNISSSPRHERQPHGRHAETVYEYQHDPYKEIDKLRKICSKLEKIIHQRNEELMKQKTKLLNLKYIRQ